MLEIIRPLAAEIAVLLLAIVALILGGRRAAWLTLLGLLGIFGLTFGATEGQSLFGGTYVEDGLSLFSKRLFLVAAALSVLGSITRGDRLEADPASRHHPFER